MKLHHFLPALLLLISAGCQQKEEMPPAPSEDLPGSGTDMDSDPDLETEKQESLSLTHNLYYFTIPTFTGLLTGAEIHWGDETIDPYTVEANHTYKTGGGHEVTILTKDAEGVLFPTLQGISKINLSQFGQAQ